MLPAPGTTPHQLTVDNLSLATGQTWYVFTTPAPGSKTSFRTHAVLPDAAAAITEELCDHGIHFSRWTEDPKSNAADSPVIFDLHPEQAKAFLHKKEYPEVTQPTAPSSAHATAALLQSIVGVPCRQAPGGFLIAGLSEPRRDAIKADLRHLNITPEFRESAGGPALFINAADASTFLDSQPALRDKHHLTRKLDKLLHADFHYVHDTGGFSAVMDHTRVTVLGAALLNAKIDYSVSFDESGSPVLTLPAASVAKVTALPAGAQAILQGEASAAVPASCIGR